MEKEKNQGTVWEFAMEDAALNSAKYKCFMWVKKKSKQNKKNKEQALCLKICTDLTIFLHL